MRYAGPSAARAFGGRALLLCIAELQPAGRGAGKRVNYAARRAGQEGSGYMPRRALLCRPRRSPYMPGVRPCRSCGSGQPRLPFCMRSVSARSCSSACWVSCMAAVGEEQVGGGSATRRCRLGGAGQRQQRSTMVCRLPSERCRDRTRQGAAATGPFSEGPSVQSACTLAERLGGPRCPLASFMSGSCFLPSQSGHADRKASGRCSTVYPARSSLRGRSGVGKAARAALLLAACRWPGQAVLDHVARVMFFTTSVPQPQNSTSLLALVSSRLMAAAAHASSMDGCAFTSRQFPRCSAKQRTALASACSGSRS